MDLPGYIYFNVTNDVIDKDDSELVVTIEYLDNRTDNFNFLYTTASGTAGHTITPANTGKWKTHSFVLTDASFSSTNKTLLASFTEDFRIEANKEDLYISKISIEKPGKKQLGNISVSSDGIISAAVTNKTAAASGATVFAAVFDKSGALQSVTPQSITIDAFGKQSISSAYGTADGKTAKLFVFEGNLKPYSSSDSLDVKVAFENGNANITWDEFVSDKDVSYKVYCDGGLVAVTDKTYYTC